MSERLYGSRSPHSVAKERGEVEGFRGLGLQEVLGVVGGGLGSWVGLGF